MKSAYFLSLLFVGLVLGPSLAHLFELPNKIGLPADDYLRVQQIYRGWDLLGMIVVGALISTGWLAVSVRKLAREFRPALAAFVCIVLAQVVFWTFTYPANAATDQWRMLPDGWERLRLQWEYGHAAGAGLNLTGYLSLVIALLRRAP